MEIYNKNGTLSAYGYSCGYVNRIEKNGSYKELYKEGSIYHLRWKFLADTKQNWECYHKLTEALWKFKTIKIQ